MNKAVVKKNIAIFFLTLMCVQYIPIEGDGASYVKFAAMCLTPLIWLNMFKTFSKVFILGGIYLIAIVFSVLYNSDSFRLSTVGYKIAFVVMFIMYYDLIYFNRALTIHDFIKFLKALIAAFFICLVLQQLAIIIGIRSMPIINFTTYLNRGIGSNSLSLEPSHAARILTVLMIVLVRMYEVKWGSRNLTLTRLYKENKWIFLGFLWSMLTMGSGTAFAGLAILGLYFIKRQYLIYSSVLILLFYISIPYINYEPFDRAKSSIEASITLDREAIIEADFSAASRIVPLIDTFSYLDLNNIDTWLGKGVDTNASYEYLSEETTIGNISDYGLVCFIISLIFVFMCCINKIWSLETLIFVFLLSLTVANVAYVWGILMLFTTSKYFYKSKITTKKKV